MSERVMPVCHLLIVSKAGNPGLRPGTPPCRGLSLPEALPAGGSPCRGRSPARRGRSSPFRPLCAGHTFSLLSSVFDLLSGLTSFRVFYLDLGEGDTYTTLA